MKFKLLVGTVLTLASVFALLVLTGSIGDRGKYSESALLVRLAMDCPRLREDDKMELQAAALVSDQDELALRFSAFGSELDRAERRRMVQSCDSIIYQLNIIPEEIRLSGPYVPPIKPEQTDCPKRGPFVGCYLLAGDTYQKSRGHLSIKTGKLTTYESFGTRQIDIGIQSLLPNMDIALEISLPDRSFPGSVVPDPDHIIGSARTLVFFEGSDRFGPSTPTVDGRAIAETLGVKLQYIFPAKAKLEDILLFFVSALFGIGSTFLVEGLLAYRNAKTAASRSRKV